MNDERSITCDIIKISEYGITVAYSRYLDLMLHLIVLFLPTTNEVCEGYVFTGVCLSTAGGLGMSRGSPSRGVCVQGCLCPRGVSVQGDLSGRPNRQKIPVR